MDYTTFRRKLRTAKALLKRRVQQSDSPLFKPSLQSERDYRGSVDRSAQTLFKFGMRMHSDDALEQLARNATLERLGWPELEQRLRTGADDAFPTDWRLPELLAAAILNCIIDPDEDALAASARALRTAVHHPKLVESLANTRMRLFALQIAVLAGDAELYDRLSAALPPTEDVQWVTRVDALHEVAFSAGGSPEALIAWRDALSEPFVDSGVEPWEFDLEPADPEAAVFGRLHAPRVDGCAIPAEEQPLVTVIVPTYNPDATFVNTIESLARQSWSNLEILIVDDHSASGTDVIARAARIDDRVQIVRQPENGGAYRARNTGLALARGEYVTVLDADDQSHPRRIEQQVAPLMRDDALVASISHAIRLYSDGSMLTFGASAYRHNASSLLFRRERVLDAIGLYDRVYKAADTEYIMRMERRFGKDRILQMPETLSLIQLTDGSLSRGDFRNGWWSGRRLAYRHQYFTWHRLALTGPEADFSIAPNGERAFVAPRTFLREPEPQRLSLALLSDWGMSVERRGKLAEALRSLPQPPDADPIGLLHGIHLRLTKEGREFLVTPELWHLVESGKATWISWDLPLEVDTLIVTSPEYLVILPNADSVGIRARRVVVLTSPDAVGELPEWIRARVRRTFGCEAQAHPVDRMEALLAPLIEASP